MQVEEGTHAIRGAGEGLGTRACENHASLYTFPAAKEAAAQSSLTHHVSKSPAPQKPSPSPAHHPVTPHKSSSNSSSKQRPTASPAEAEKPRPRHVQKARHTKTLYKYLSTDLGGRQAHNHRTSDITYSFPSPRLPHKKERGREVR